MGGGEQAVPQKHCNGLNVVRKKAVQNVLLILGKSHKRKKGGEENELYNVLNQPFDIVVTEIR